MKNRSFAFVGLWIGILVFAGCQGSEQTVSGAILRAEEFLIRHQRPDGAIADARNPLFDTWETVWAAYALSYAEGDSAKLALQAALDYLKSQTNESGLICHNMRCRSQYCIETSAAYALLLGRMKSPEVEAVQTAIWQKRHIQGYWEIGNPDVRIQRKYPSVTGFAFWALASNPIYKDSTKKAGEFILNTQNPNGSWGATWEYYGTDAYGIWACGEALLAIDNPSRTVQESLERAAKFICDRQLETGGWDFKLPNLKRSPSDELITALVLNFLSDKNGPEIAFREKAVQFLLNTQNRDGGWNGGFFPVPKERYEKREDLFATAMALIALRKELEAELP
jgi:squalene cyclase